MNVSKTQQAPRGRARRAATWLTLLGLLAVVVSTALALRHERADALASCVPHTNTAEELTFLSGLQSWRDANIPGSFGLTVSGPLNAAAAGYAQYLIDHPGTGGHYADGGGQFAWASRAVNCGYPSGEAAGGEGLAVVQSSGQVSVSPQQAITIMTSERGGGVWVPADVGAPVKCVGVAKVSAANGTEVAWVTLLFATFDTCPQAQGGGGGLGGAGGGSSPTTSPTNTSTPTPTATATPTRTPTPTTTPYANHNAQITIYSGWNLVTLPPGAMSDIMDTARGCYSVVYQVQNGQWLRYIPGAPPFASNLTNSNGGAAWILGTQQDCGIVRL